MGEPDPSLAAFAVPADGYDLLIGRYLPELAPAFADAAGISAGQRALDVGCGPGGLTVELARRLGADHVAGVDPSEQFVQACRDRLPGTDVRVGVAEELPFPDGTFSAALACLVVGFMSDALAGVREMVRVTESGGSVALCFWNYEQMPMLRTFFAAAVEIDPRQLSENQRLGTRSGDLPSLLEAAGLTDVTASSLTATASYADFADWWSPFPHGVGPPGLFHQSLTGELQARLKSRCFELLGAPSGAFRQQASAWCAVGRVG